MVNDYQTAATRTPNCPPRGGILLPPADEAEARGIRTGFTLVEPDYAGMKAIAALVETGQLHAEIDTVLPLAQAAKAHVHGETGRTAGKIVLSVTP